MLRARLEIGLKLKKSLEEVDEMPHAHLMLFVALLNLKAEERKKAAKKGK